MTLVKLFTHIITKLYNLVLTKKGGGALSLSGNHRYVRY